MNNFVTTIFIIAISLFGFNQAAANTNTDNWSIDCYDCTELQQILKVENYVYLNTPFEDLWSAPLNKTAHVINFKSGSVVSYSIRISPPEYVTDDYDFNATRIKNTPKDILDSVRLGYLALKSLKKSVEELTIPESVISNAWEFVNCAYCEVAVNNHFNSQLEGEVLTVTNTIARIASVLNLISTGIPDVYRLKLENGGYVDLKVKLLRGPILKLTVMDVVDEADNKVPLKSALLENLRVKIGSVDHADNINKFIKDFNFSVPQISTGSVTIKECEINHDYVPGRPGVSQYNCN